MCVDIFSYLLGKKSGGGGGGSLDDYFTNSDYGTYIGGYLKKLPFDVDLTGKSSIGSICQYYNNLETITFKNGSGITNVRTAFEGCIKLMFLDVRDIIFSAITTYTNYMVMLGTGTKRVPTDCLIIVKDNTEKEWFATNFASWTNVKTVAEYEAQ